MLGDQLDHAHLQPIGTAAAGAVLDHLGDAEPWAAGARVCTSKKPPMFKAARRRPICRAAAAERPSFQATAAGPGRGCRGEFEEQAAGGTQDREHQGPGPRPSHLFSSSRRIVDGH